MQRFDSLDEDEGGKLCGRKVVDPEGEPVGTADGVWIDPSTHRVAYVGVKTSWLPGKVQVLPAGDLEIAGGSELIRVCYPAAFVKKAPSSSPETELAQVEKEEINAYFGRFQSDRRVSSIQQMRPEEANLEKVEEQSEPHDTTRGSEKDRVDLERGEQSLFDQKGFVTDTMPEVDASQELLRTQEEAKIRNREDRMKEGSSD
ncbi:MAG: PRC-barrel domain-containing protein [Verrucomicrobia bacterium]|nr:PRC-barrel domain-containing protein [Verrucomicrobiota bacterium]